jgi:CheY-like chemotaxis protein
VPHRYFLLSLDASCSAVAGVSGLVFAQATTSNEARGGAAAIALSLGVMLVGRVFDEVAERRKRRAAVEDRDYERRQAEFRRQQEQQELELEVLRQRVRAVSAKVGSNEGKADASLKLLTGSGIRAALDPAAAPAGTEFPVVLVVEDDPNSAKVLARMLGQAGYEVIHSPTVVDALLYIDAAPAVVLLDLNLPDGNGLAVLEAIRGRGLQSRVFVMTGSADEATMERLAELKPEKVCFRPLNFNDLVAAMRTPAPGGAA